MMSFINYDFTVSLGLQESLDVIGKMGVAVNKGFDVSDTIIYLPLLAIGPVGLWIGKKWELFAMIDSLGITVFAPMVNIFLLLLARGSQGFNFTEFKSNIIIPTAITIYALWGIWYLYTIRSKKRILINSASIY